MTQRGGGGFADLVGWWDGGIILSHQNEYELYSIMELFHKKYVLKENYKKPHYHIGGGVKKKDSISSLR